MLNLALLTLADRKSPRYGANRAERARPRPSSSQALPHAAQQRFSAPPLPDGWHARVRAQTQSLARALELIEQALGMLHEPRADALAQAQCLRGASLITLIAASELLVSAGFFEADHAVRGGTSAEPPTSPGA